MKMLKQRIAKAFGGGTSERGTSNLEIVVWISVVLVIAVGLFFLRDNIAKFINNAATQIAGEEKAGVCVYGKQYVSEDGRKFIFYEDGNYSLYIYGEWWNHLYCDTYGAPMDDGVFSTGEGDFTFSSDGKTAINNGIIFQLQE